MDEESIFAAALEKRSATERAEFLENACRGDARLRAEVEELLVASDQADRFFESPAWAVGAPSDESALREQPGSIVGQYELLQQIGEGGMGVVFLAQQKRPIQRTVAVKIIKPGMDSRQVIARFAAERQVLALMDHPNIARVLDAGTTDTGRPYFVMDLVEGLPITDYCDQAKLPVEKRLRLFIAVCQAVQHAHQKGIIHRDLKPSNILVRECDGQPQPKIIDFGVAKAMGGQFNERTMSTRVGQIIGTIEYMSPEQARFNQLDVDTRSDIYSLGVLLYELLTGTTTFDKQQLETLAFDETLRVIREEEPPRPSTRLSSTKELPIIAARRQLEPARLSRLISGELDWIVMKCLEKDRDRRYETASALAADLLHHLNDEPVNAGAPSRLYRAGKFVRRNKVAVMASAAVLSGLVAGIFGTTIGLVSQSRQRVIAERERAEAQFNDALSLQMQAKYVEAEALFRRGLESTIGATPGDRRRAARTRLRLARLAYDRGNATQSERLHRDALAAHRAAFPPGDPNIAQALGDLASILQAQRRFAEAEPLIREAREIHRRAVPTNHFLIATSGTVLGNTLITLGKFAEAEPILRDALAEHDLVVPPDGWAVALTRTALGRDLIMMGKFPEAEAQLIEAERALATTEDFRHGCLSLAALYTAWDQAEPGNGFDAKAHEWFLKSVQEYIRPLSDASKLKETE